MTRDEIIDNGIKAREIDHLAFSPLFFWHKYSYAICCFLEAGFDPNPLSIITCTSVSISKFSFFFMSLSFMLAADFHRELRYKVPL